MARNYLARSYRYYRKNGFTKSVRFLGRRLVKNLSRSPDSAAVFIARHYKLLNDPEQSSQPSPAPELFGAGTVAIIADLNLQQCKKYRVIQKLECADNIGLQANYSHWEDTPRCYDLLQIASVVIFYRVQANSRIQAYIDEARRLGIPILYDIDDPIFDQKVYAQNSNLGFLTGKEMRHLLSGSPRYVSAIKQCDAAIVSTPGMREVLSQHYSGEIFLWRNAVDQASVHAAAVALKEYSTANADRVTIGYASGSRAHEADFRVVVDALVEILNKYPQTDLKILGHLELPDQLKSFGERIFRSPFGSYEAYFRTLSTFDISIVPLIQDDFNQCKSAIRFLEASLVNVPTIVSATGDFINVIAPGKTGRLVANPSQWVSQLEDLVSSPQIRREIARNARAHVLETQTTAAVMQTIDGELAHLLRGTSHGR